MHNRTYLHRRNDRRRNLSLLPNWQNSTWIRWKKHDRGILISAGRSTTAYLRAKLVLLREKFGERVISRRFLDLYDCRLECPQYSPYISCLDFFFWGYLKDWIYQDNPKTISGLKRRIELELGALEPEILQNVSRRFENRVRMLITLESEHIENVIHWIPFMYLNFVQSFNPI